MTKRGKKAKDADGGSTVDEFYSVTKARADRGMFLSYRELAAVTGLSRHRIGQIAKEPGFPLMENRVRFVDFEIWYRRKIGLIADAPGTPMQTASEEKPFEWEHVPHYLKSYLNGHPGIAKAMWEYYKKRKLTTHSSL